MFGQGLPAIIDSGGIMVIEWTSCDHDPASNRTINYTAWTSCDHDPTSNRVVSYTSWTTCDHDPTSNRA